MANRGKKRRILSYLLSYDTNLIVAVIFLIVFGLIMIYSASYYTASMRQSYNYDPTFLLKSQLNYRIVAPFVIPLVANINYGTWRYFAFVGLFAFPMEYADSDSAFRIARIQAWLDPYSYESDTAYQALQALYAIGSGGLFGKGLGNSIQKLGAIPEAYNDMIFAIVCEELGIFGAGLVILMFIYLRYRLYSVAQQAEDLFGRLLTIGVFSHVALQVILNLMVVTSLFPTTGVTLPFFSYGGTATVFLLVEIGMVLNVEKESRFKREREMREARLE